MRNKERGEPIFFDEQVQGVTVRPAVGIFTICKEVRISLEAFIARLNFTVKCV